MRTVSRTKDKRYRDIRLERVKVLPLSRAAGDHNLEAETLSNLGAVYLRMGDPSQGHFNWRAG